MGRLVAELPDGRIHAWTGNDREQVQSFLQRFRRHVKRQVTDSPQIQWRERGLSLEEAVDGWIYGMAHHVLTASPAASAELESFRHMFRTYLMLTSKVPVDSEHAGIAFSELLPEHDIDFRLEVLDEGIAVDARVWPQSRPFDPTAEAEGDAAH